MLKAIYLLIAGPVVCGFFGLQFAAGWAIADHLGVGHAFLAVDAVGVLGLALVALKKLAHH